MGDFNEETLEMAPLFLPFFLGDGDLFAIYFRVNL